MPVDLKAIRNAGGTKEALRKKFDLKEIKPGGRIEELLKLSASRVNDGLSSNFRDAKMWWAIDRAYDVNQRQTSPTLLEGFINRRPKTSEDVLSAAKDFGLDEMLAPMTKCGQTVCDSSGNQVYKFDIPTFFNIYVPLVHQYLTTRVAKIFSDRDTYPLYPYDPIRLTMKDRLKAEIITGRIQRMATDMSYRAEERQSIHQACLYGVALNFPIEDWWKTEQLWHGKKKVMKEGVRHAIPHPSRTFYDLNHPLRTLNSDTGCAWAGHWDIIRFGELSSSKHYWNMDVVNATYGKYNWLKSDGWRIYQELFPCRFPFPSVGARQGAGDQDRLERAYYTAEQDYDRGVTLVSLFQKLNPKEWGLYDYDEEVWHRMVFASEDTLIWCSPLAYNPCVAYAYDHDDNRAFNTSLGLELMPWQDLMGNYLTQLFLSVKQNLMNVVFWNEDLLDQKYVELIENLGEKLYRKTNFVPFSREKWSWQKQTERDVFHRVDFPKHDTGGILMAIETMLQVMERMLGYTPEEVGSTGSGEESATKTALRDRNRNTRLAYTGSFIDDARHAKKVQLYDAMMAYSDDEIFAEVADMNDAKRGELEKMGFEVESDGDKQSRPGVRGSKESLVIDGFATDRDATGRLPDTQIAQMMIQTFQSIFSNPQIVERVGLDTLIDLFNQMLYYAGLPKDFRLVIHSEGGQAGPDQAQEQLAQMLSQVEQRAVGASAEMIKQEMEQMGGAMREVLQPIQEQQAQLAEAIGMLAKRTQEGDQRDAAQDAALQQLIQALQPQAQPAPEQMMGAMQ